MSKRKNGQGTIIKLENGKYRLVKQVGILPNGRPKRLTVTGTSETDCIKKMSKKEHQLCDGNLNTLHNELNKLTLTDLCNSHLDYDINLKGKLKKKSINRREDTINNQIKAYPIGGFQAATVTPQDIYNHIELLISENKLSVSSIEKAFNVVNGAYKWANNMGYYNSNPCIQIKDAIKNRLSNLNIKNSSDGTVLVISSDQIDNISNYVKRINSCNSTSYYFGLSVIILLKTGMRVGELCALRWKDFYSNTNVLHIHRTRNVVRDRNTGKYVINENEVKNYHARTIRLDNDAIEALNEMYSITKKKEVDDYIVLNSEWKPSNPTQYGRNINSLYNKAGFPDDISGCHILRRTCATQMYNSGCSIEDIAAYLGDTPETIRKHYISLTKKIVSDGEILNVVEYPRKK